MSGELRTFKITSPMGVREWHAENEDRARKQHEDSFPDEPILVVSTHSDASGGSPSRFLVYADENGGQHYQPVADVVSVGTLIDPDSGDDMELVGWSKSDGGEVSTEDMELVYRDGSGNEHRQSWQTLDSIGVLIDPDSGDDMELTDTVTGTSVVHEYVSLSDCLDDETHGSITDDDGYCTRCGNMPEEDVSCCAGCECGNACAADCEVGPVCQEYAPVFPEYQDAPSLEDALLGMDTEKNDEKAALARAEYEADLAEALPKVMNVPSVPSLVKFSSNTSLVQEFDHLRQKWGPTMSVQAGRGKKLYEAARETPLNLRKVPRDVASGYGGETGSCLMCGKPLKDAASSRRGYGPDCASKIG